MLPYVDDSFAGLRRATREVLVGDVGIGGDNPIRVQSMTTTDTRDTAATVHQIERLADAGCEIVRVTAPSITDAENLRSIVAELRQRGVRIPLVADIHFTPNAAMIAATIVEKVRVNPGNYADKKKFEQREYSDAEYAKELERVAHRFRPLVLRCKEEGRALRIGTNHGSLSDRVMNRYGDSPAGMVESALEFLDVCEGEGYREVVFSMKSSNPQVAVHAYRLLAARLEARAPGEPLYPFHVGVTEAGDGEDGRIKSAIGIGALLEDGLGDTIRVSLTEDPVREVPVARALAIRAEARWWGAAECAEPSARVTVNAPFCDDPYSHTRRAAARLDLGGLVLGGDEPVRVEIDHGRLPGDPAGLAAAVATGLGLVASDLACESHRVGVAFEKDLASVEAFARALEPLGALRPIAVGLPIALAGKAARIAGVASRVVLPVDRAADAEALSDAAVELRAAGLSVELQVVAGPDERPAATLLERVDTALQAADEVDPLLLSVASPRATHAARIVAARLREHGSDAPLGLCFTPLRADAGGSGDALLDAAVDLGAPLCDGIGDLVSLPTAAFGGDTARTLDVAYRILQGARLRTTRTEYISCPSCGRTLFDLEETTARIKARTDHLKGVKIAVMGCIVNGPGEMADADFGYVGSGPGVVTLYVGKEIVVRAVPETEAPDRLVELIRERGHWREADA